MHVLLLSDKLMTSRAGFRGTTGCTTQEKVAVGNPKTPRQYLWWSRTIYGASVSVSVDGM